jgi:uncharacterized membrane protein
MDKQKTNPDPDFAPPERRAGGSLFTVISVSFGLTCAFLVACSVLFATVVVKALDDMFASFGFFIWITFAVFVMPTVIELLFLLQTGQPIRFVVRLVETLCN